MGIPITASNMTESAKVKYQNIKFAKIFTLFIQNADLHQIWFPLFPLKISAGFLPLERERPLGLLLEEFLRKKIRLKVSRFPGLQVDLVSLSLPSLREPEPTDIRCNQAFHLLGLGEYFSSSCLCELLFYFKTNLF